jgi:hypothetical protein
MELRPNIFLQNTGPKMNYFAPLAIMISVVLGVYPQGEMLKDCINAVSLCMENSTVQVEKEYPLYWPEVSLPLIDPRIPLKVNLFHGDINELALTNPCKINNSLTIQSFAIFPKRLDLEGRRLFTMNIKLDNTPELKEAMKSANHFFLQIQNPVLDSVGGCIVGPRSSLGLAGSFPVVILENDLPLKVSYEDKVLFLETLIVILAGIVVILIVISISLIFWISRLRQERKREFCDELEFPLKLSQNFESLAGNDRLTTDLHSKCEFAKSKTWSESLRYDVKSKYSFSMSNTEIEKYSYQTHLCTSKDGASGCKNATSLERSVARKRPAPKLKELKQNGDMLVNERIDSPKIMVLNECISTPFNSRRDDEDLENESINGNPSVLFMDSNVDKFEGYPTQGHKQQDSNSPLIDSRTDVNATSISKLANIAENLNIVDGENLQKEYAIPRTSFQERYAKDHPNYLEEDWRQHVDMVVHSLREFLANPPDGWDRQSFDSDN